MRDTIESSSGAQQHPHARHSKRPSAALSRDLEASDPLARHDITLQFAGFRAGGGTGAGVCPLPASVYFTYQMYNCQPTRTERMVL
ncbi:unnamed protein product, partial [Discosporangium mesarthrocarpum]